MTKSPHSFFEFLKIAFAAFCLWVGGWFLATFLCVLYYRYVFEPNLNLIGDIYSLFSNYNIFLIWISTPGILIIAYLLHLTSTVLIARVFLNVSYHHSPSYESLNANEISGKTPEEVRYLRGYYFRGFVLRFVRWMLVHSMFPWLIPWAFNFMGNNRIGKGTVLEDQFHTLESLTTEENVYIGTGSIVSNHLVEGSYQGLIIKPVSIGKNTVLGASTAIAPGVMVEANVEVLPLSGVPKFQQLKGNSKYEGLPIHPISEEQYRSWLRFNLIVNSNGGKE